MTVIHWVVIGVVLVVALLVGYNYYACLRDKAHIKSWQEVHTRLIQYIERQNYTQFLCTDHQIKALEFICQRGLIVEGLMYVGVSKQVKYSLILEMYHQNEMYLCALNKNTKNISLFPPKIDKGVLYGIRLNILELRRLVVGLN